MAAAVHPNPQRLTRSRSGSVAPRPWTDAASQVAVLAALWGCYAAVRSLVGDTQQVAMRNASRILDLQAAVGLDVERGLQSLVGGSATFVAANSYYLLHFPVTLAALLVAYWRARDAVFPTIRNALVGATGVALVVHLVIPVAPPRMLNGFIDAGAAFGPDPYAVAGSESANQFAALPSMHVAWAILVGWAVTQLRPTMLGRAVGLAHPVITAIVVIVTGHHFVTDAVLGATLALGFVWWAGDRRKPDLTLR